ncbi:hypothetical protein NM208_g8202 [Fusarium decemcellulare]|uniref:Uncharacterized protein n=1 Tax=Fusarium decemcellulare TaxID=57161 RepID=A0ACC1S6C9_9HYPO|nr:hypothetical protein NM208_g8202 [Fusarium decemcellulare]
MGQVGVDAPPSAVPAEAGTLNPYSCLPCRERKRKCDRVAPCANCRKVGAECRFVPRRPSTRQPASVALLERLRHLETIISRMQNHLGPEVLRDIASDAANLKQLPKKTTQTPQLESAKDVDELGTDFGRLAMGDGRSRYVIGSCWASLSDEVEDLKSLLQGRPEEAGDSGAVPDMCMTNHASILGFGPVFQSLSQLHPPAGQIAVYWSLFKQNCDMLIKVLHIPTTETLIWNATQQLDRISRGQEALMMAMYFAVVVSLPPDECLQKLGGDKTSLLCMYRSATEQALSRARLLETDEIITLQAFAIFLTSLRTHNSVRAMSTLTALLVRLAQHAGIHRDGTHFNLPPFVTEMRRRLWWSICVLDSRASEDTGYDAIIPPEKADTQLPLNVNDSDLFPAMAQLPQPRVGLTEMTFSVVRFESTRVFRHLQYMSTSPSAGPSLEQSMEEKKRMISDIQHRLDELYLKHLDLSNPLSWFTSTICQIVFGKMSLVAYHPSLRKGSSDGVPDGLFAEATGVIECWLRLNEEKSTRRWRWLCETYFQWYALAFLLSELCKRTQGEEVDRAWRAVEGALRLGHRIHSSSTLSAGTDSSQQRDVEEPSCPLYKPLSKLLKRAREARRKALGTNGDESGWEYVMPEDSPIPELPIGASSLGTFGFDPSGTQDPSEMCDNLRASDEWLFGGASSDRSMAKSRRHSEPNSGQDLENLHSLGRFEQETGPSIAKSDINIPPFIGRLGGNGAEALTRCSSNEDFLEYVPDAAPLMSLGEALNLKPFLSVGLWKSALMEGVGSLMIVWLTIYANVSPVVIPQQPTQRWGNFDNASFIGPLVGGILNFFYLTLFTFCFGAVSGAHLNPTITIATLFARLCSLPRAVLYVSFQIGGSALGGLLARASYGTREFKVGGCWLYPDIVPVREAFTVEFMTCTILLFFAFGVGLDPRQRQIVGPTLGPFMVGISLASLSFGTGYVRVADIAACLTHAVFYHIVPPWQARVK